VNPAAVLKNIPNKPITIFNGESSKTKPVVKCLAITNIPENVKSHFVNSDTTGRLIKSKRTEINLPVLSIISCSTGINISLIVLPNFSTREGSNSS
jgi:hypothetical protein